MTSGQKVVAIVQARMGSSRLPNKMMLWLHGIPVIEWVRCRLLKSKRLDMVVFAIPGTKRDDVLEAYLRSKGANVFRGSEHDVLARFQTAARHFGATHIVRVCADNPLISWEEVDNLVSFYFANACDYAYNHIPRGNRYPDGLGAEMASMDILQALHQLSHAPRHREHVLSYLWDNEEHFSILTFDPPDPKIASPDLKLDIDTYEDYQRLLSMPIDVYMTAREIVGRFKEVGL